MRNLLDKCNTNHFCCRVNVAHNHGKYFQQKFKFGPKLIGFALWLFLSKAQGWTWQWHFKAPAKQKVVIQRSGQTAQAINPHLRDGHWGVTSWLPQEGTRSKTGQRWRQREGDSPLRKSSVQTKTWPSSSDSKLTWKGTLKYKWLLLKFRTNP